MQEYEYVTRESCAESGLACWAFKSNTACETRVIPDGCRDVIVREAPSGHRRWFVSDLSATAYRVVTAPGVRMYGIRLKPGVRIHSGELERWLSGCSSRDLLESNQLDEFCLRPEFVADALARLAVENCSVASAARELGVSTRTLQRTVLTGTQKTPQFWIALARARRAVKSLPYHEQLSEAALANGYSDQAHMTRAIKSWFQLTPGQAKSDPELLNLLDEPGYGQ